MTTQDGRHDGRPVSSPTPPTGAPLARAAERLAPLLDDRSRRLVADAVTRAQAGHARVLVLGEAKRGKTSLVNVITGSSLLPTGALPLTSVATVIRVGDHQAARARTDDGSWRPLAVDEVAGLVSERGNPGNRERIDQVEVTVATDRLPPGTEVVDTPGTGSVHELNTLEADRAREILDLAVLVVSVDPPLSRAELDLLTEAHHSASRSVVVINKVDLAGREQIGEVVDFTATVLAERLGDIPVFPLSARTGAGVEEFLSWLDTQLRTHGARDADTSARELLRRLGNSVRDSIHVEQQLRRRDRDDAHTRQQTLEAGLTQARARTSAATDRLDAQQRRLRRDLDTAHHQAVDEALTTARAASEETPATATAGSSPEQAAASRRTMIADRASCDVHRWFDDQSAQLRTSMQTLAADILGDLRNDLATARSAAAELLDLTLTPVAAAEPLALWGAPTLSLSDGPAWTELVTATLARRLPPHWRRQRLRRDLHRWIDATVPRLFGQARSQLQRELQNATRALARAVNHEWERQLAALEQGLDAARHAREELTEQTEDRGKVLAGREHEIDHALGLLED